MPFIDEANARLIVQVPIRKGMASSHWIFCQGQDSPTVIINQVLPRNYIHDVYVEQYHVTLLMEAMDYLFIIVQVMHVALN